MYANVCFYIYNKRRVNISKDTLGVFLLVIWWDMSGSKEQYKINANLEL